MGIRATYVVFVLLALVPRVAAEPREPDETISLGGLVELAVRKSPGLKLVRANRRIAELGKQTSAAPGETRVQASVDASTQREAPIANARAQVVEDTRIGGSVGVSKLLPTGGDLALTLSAIERRRVFGEAPDAPSIANIQSVHVSVRQPLLRDRGQGAQVEVRKATLAADASSLRAQDDHAATLRELIVAYWELAHERDALAVRRQSMALAQSQVDLTRKMHDRGAVPDSAIKAARYGLALREEALLRAQDAVQASSLQLRRLAGLELTIELGDLVPTDALVVPIEAIEVEGAIATALARSPRIAAARLGVAVADVELVQRRNRALPSLDISASAGAVGVGGDPASALSALGTGASFALTGSVTFGWEVGGSARAASESARVERTAAKLSATEVEREVISLVIETARSLRAARSRAEVARRAIELASANLDTELALFRADKSNNVQVFERQAELDEARLLASRAAADCNIALATLDYLTGELLEHHGVALASK